MRLLRRNVILIYGVYAVTLASGLVVTPIIVGALGTEQFGIWALIGSILGFIALLDLGIGPSVIRFAAEQRGRGVKDETSELTSTAFAIYLVLALVTMLLAVVLAWLLPHAVEISDQYVRAAQIAVVISVGTFVLRFPVGLFSYLLAGQQRYDVLNIGNLLGAVVYFGLAVAVLYVADGGLVALALITVVVAAVRLLPPLFWLKQRAPGAAPAAEPGHPSAGEGAPQLQLAQHADPGRVEGRRLDGRDRRRHHLRQRRRRRLRDPGQALRPCFRRRDRVDDAPVSGAFRARRRGRSGAARALPARRRPARASPSSSRSGCRSCSCPTASSRPGCHPTSTSRPPRRSSRS